MDWIPRSSRTPNLLWGFERGTNGRIVLTNIAPYIKEGDLVIDQVDSEGIYEGARVRP